MSEKTVNYSIVDVFTNDRYSGNPLAVIHDGSDLTKGEMLKIANEFGFSETSVIFPPKDDQYNAHVRIFTPMEEIPFAGHPNIGTAYIIANKNTAAATKNNTNKLLFDELGGDVDVTLCEVEGHFTGAEIIAPQSMQMLAECDLELVAKCLELMPGKILTDRFTPCIATVGLPFAFAEVDSLNDLADIKLNISAFKEAAAKGPKTVDGFCICAFTVIDESENEISLRSRVFSPLGYPPEDPATGSASGALGALLTRNASSTPYKINITQGVEMGRRSDIVVQLDTIDGAPRISGNCVLISEGIIYL